MTGLNDKNAEYNMELDKTFKEVFDALPEQAASNGWDTPSPKVWANIQTDLQLSPKGTTFNLNLWASAAVLSISALALWWFFANPSAPAKSPTPTTEQVQENLPTSIPATDKTQEEASVESTSPAVSAPVFVPEKKTTSFPKTPTLKSSQTTTRSDKPVVSELAPINTPEPNQAEVQVDVPTTPVPAVETVVPKSEVIHPAKDKNTNNKTEAEKVQFPNNLERIKAAEKKEDQN